LPLKPGNEENTGVIPLSKEAEVVVAPIHGDDATSGKREMTSGGYITISNNGKGWQISVMVQEQMELNGTFGLAEVGPEKQAETKVDGGGIEAKQSIFGAELPLLSGALVAKQVV
jgi:hypothetical protein